MELFDTIDLMTSSDYKDRFIAEYYQVKERYIKLNLMLKKWDNGELNFTPTCSKSIFQSQLSAMKNYINVLELRAKLENINLINN